MRCQRVRESDAGEPDKVSVAANASMVLVARVRVKLNQMNLPALPIVTYFYGPKHYFSLLK